MGHRASLGHLKESRFPLPGNELGTSVGLRHPRSLTIMYCELLGSEEQNLHSSYLDLLIDLSILRCRCHEEVTEILLLTSSEKCVQSVQGTVFHIIDETV